MKSEIGCLFAFFNIYNTICLTYKCTYMRKLAFWARENKNTARLTIIISYILLNMLALFTGDVLHSLNIEFTPLLFIFTVAMTFLGCMIYPSKIRKKEYRNFFARQKSADLLLVCSTFLFIVYAGNSLNKNWNTIYNSAQAISLIPPSASTSITHSSSTKTAESKKSFSKKIRAEIKSLRKAYKDSTKSQKTLYIILAVLAAAGLAYGLAAVACGISCSGSEALAIAVFAVGLGGIVFGLVKLIQRISRGKPKM